MGNTSAVCTLVLLSYIVYNATIRHGTDFFELSGITIWWTLEEAFPDMGTMGKFLMGAVLQCCLRKDAYSLDASISVICLF